MGKLYLIAGHGAGDPGAVGNGFQEAVCVRRLCTRIKDFGGDQVVVLDMNRNWYADRGILNLSIGKGDYLMECHMDAGVAAARGGHVIIAQGLDADRYDRALAKLLQDYLPGRAKIIVQRGDLANPNRAKARGINYRLVEFGFITNSNDVNIFNTKLDELAKGILQAFFLDAQAASGRKMIIAVDGSWGLETTEKAQRVMGTVVDGVVSRQPNENRQYLTNASTFSWEFRESGYSGGSALVKAIQRMTGASEDGYFGKESVTALQRYLNQQNYSLQEDGYLGRLTVRAWQEFLNKR